MEKIFQVIKKNDIPQLRVLLSKTWDTDYVVDGWTPLTYACDRGKEEIVEILIENIKQSVSMLMDGVGLLVARSIDRAPDLKCSRPGFHYLFDLLHFLPSHFITTLTKKVEGYVL
jgi:hypothetical protein